MRRIFATAVFASATAASTTALLIAVPGVASASSSTRATTYADLNVVSQPVAGVGSAVVITSDKAHTLHLEGIVPATGKVLWSHPYSESVIIPGIAPTVYTEDNNVIDIVPAGAASNPEVNIEGINATTGAVAWTAERGIVLADQPLPCADKKDFCIIGFNNNGTTAMAVLNPITGLPTEVVSGPFRALDDDLYQTDATNPVLEEFSPFGTFLWNKTVTALFGKAGYNPVNGWDLYGYGATEVGSISPTAQDNSDGLDNAETIGIAIASGAVNYRLNGEFQCGGTLGFESPTFLCQFSGSIPKVKVPSQGKGKGKSTTTTTTPKANTNPLSRSLKGLRLTLRGFDATTGAITWSVPVRDVTQLANGQVEFLDATHLLVQLANGHPAILDTATGATKTVSKNRTFWCTALTLFKVDENRQVNPSEERVEGNPYMPCDAFGHAVTTLPKASPLSMGTTVNGIFLWESPHGLSSRVVGQQSGIA